MIPKRHRLLLGLAAALAALIVLGGLLQAIRILLWELSYFLPGWLITPLLLRRTVNLLPTVALTAQLGMGALLGLPGVLLALPLVVVMQVIMQTVVVQQIMDRWN